jgi:hypothetical protein
LYSNIQGIAKDARPNIEIAEEVNFEGEENFELQD